MQEVGVYKACGMLPFLHSRTAERTTFQSILPSTRNAYTQVLTHVHCYILQ